MTLKRLTFDITQEDHAEIKIRAAQRNISMRDWLMQAIADRIKSEKKYELEE